MILKKVFLLTLISVSFAAGATPTLNQGLFVPDHQFYCQQFATPLMSGDTLIGLQVNFQSPCSDAVTLFCLSNECVAFDDSFQPILTVTITGPQSYIWQNTVFSDLVHFQMTAK